MTLALLYVGIGNWAFIVPALFYSLREVYQYAIGKRHNGRFDWGGCVPVWISQLIIGLLWYF
jgi:hypothetical protein